MAKMNGYCEPLPHQDFARHLTVVLKIYIALTVREVPCEAELIAVYLIGASETVGIW